jgi:hypothetical protein
MKNISVEMIVKPKTPKKINRDIKALLSILKISHENPKYLRFTYCSAEYLNAFCFQNCENEKDKIDCEIIYGWSLWEDRKNKFFEAEFHSVIEENGVLVDITPRPKNEKYILFVTDMSRISGRKSIDSWYSWSNLKMVDGNVVEASEELEVVQLDAESSEFRNV